MDSPLDAFPSETSHKGLGEVTSAPSGEAGHERQCVDSVPLPKGTSRTLSGLIAAGRSRAKAGAAGFTRAFGRHTATWLGRPIPSPSWTRGDRFPVIATAALTSAGVSLLTMWLWSQGQAPGSAGAVAVSGPRTQPVAPSMQVMRERPFTGRVLAPVAAHAASSAPPRPTDAPVASRAPVTAFPNARPGDDPPATRAADALARLVVMTEPKGARVTINGVGWGTTPLTVRYLPPGVKRVRVTRSGYRSEERVVSMDTGRAATLRIALRKSPELLAAQ